MRNDPDYDAAHEADMAELRKEQLEADCGGDQADEDDSEDDPEWLDQQNIDRMQSEIEVDCADDSWVIASWPCGTWCDWHERHGYAHKSDDYEKLIVVSYGADGYYPIKTKPAV